MRRALPVLLLALAACTPMAPAPSTSTIHQGYKPDPAWPKKPGSIVWGEVSGVAVDKQDNVWVYVRSAPHLQIYAPDGTLIKTWPALEHKRAHHIKFDPEGNVWLSDVGLHTVRKYSVDGALLLTLGTPGVAGSDERHFNQPTDMAITPAGDIFVSDGYLNTRVVHFDKTGRYVKAWGAPGTGPGQFNLVHAIVVDSKGRLYVGDRSNSRIQVFEQSGAFVEQWRNLIIPWGLWILPNDEIWACGPSPVTADKAGTPPVDQMMMRLTTSGRVLEVWCPKVGPLPGETEWVHAIAMDSKANVYVGDVKGHRIQKLVPAP